MSTDEEENDMDSSTDEEVEAAMMSMNVNDYKKGLVRPLVDKKNFTNDVAGLRERLADLKESFPDWVERMDVTSTLKTVERKSNAEEQESAVDPSNDFSREMHFLRQAQCSTYIGIEKLKELDVPTGRPLDYFAEMIKTDNHMRKVRERLLSRQKRMEVSEKAKKMREMKKYGKRVQEEVTEKRRREKKELLQSVKKYVKGNGEKPDFLKRDKDEDEFPTKVEHKRFLFKNSKRQKGVPGNFKSKKRQMKDQKYGVNGKKRNWKRNTAESSADMSSFNNKRRGAPANSRTGGKNKKGGTKPRPGKTNRHKMKQRNRKF